MYRILLHLDRRWIFLAMFLAVAVPILLKLTFPEFPSAKARTVFDTIEGLPEGSKVLISLDYDPASQGELAPMSSAFTRHCCEKKLKLYYMTLWDRGPPIVQGAMDLIQREYPHMKYGVDYVNFGFKAGLQVAVRNAVSNMKNDFLTDQYGTSIQQIPMSKDVKNLQEMDLLICVGSGSPGPKEWVQFAAAPYGLKMLAGSPGVQTPQLLPYIPQQLAGMLGAIKSAAEYEQTLIDAKPQLAKVPEAKEGLRRMGPQLVAHVLMVVLIVLGNYVYFRQRTASRVA